MNLDLGDPTIPQAEERALRSYLADQYRGILDEEQLAAHARDYVGLQSARANLAAVRPFIGRGPVLDVGCGFGTFVFACLEAGISATGVDVAETEIEFARARLRRLRPAERAEDVYRVGSGDSLDFPDAVWRAVTLWNVLEHVPDPKPLLAECARVLQPGGVLFSVCPNYAAWRDEPHYHVSFPPLLPRPLATRYLMVRGRDPRFFETSIFYRTNREVLRTLRDVGLRPSDPRALKSERPEELPDGRVRTALLVARRLGVMPLVRAGLHASFASPWRASIIVLGRKPEAGG